MKLNEIRDNPGAHYRAKRVGRGIGSGKGKTSGRGGKGQTARSGVAHQRLRGRPDPAASPAAEARLQQQDFPEGLQGRQPRPAAAGARRREARPPSGTIDGKALVAAGVLRRLATASACWPRANSRPRSPSRSPAPRKAAIAAVEKAGGKVVLPAGAARRSRARRKRIGPDPARAPGRQRPTRQRPDGRKAKQPANWSDPLRRRSMIGRCVTRVGTSHMASAAEQLAASINFGAFSKATELKSRIWFTLGALVVYRLGTYIPIPGIDPAILQEIFKQQCRRHPRHVRHVLGRRARAHDRSSPSTSCRTSRPRSSSSS